MRKSRMTGTAAGTALRRVRNSFITTLQGARMSREDYARFVEDFCDDLGIEQSDEVLHRGLLQVDDTLIGIEYLDAREEVRILMDLGETEVDTRSELLALLLEANLGNTSLCLPTFSMHPETRHPIVAYHVPLQALLDEELDLALVLQEHMVPMLAEWRSAVDEALDAERKGAELAPLAGARV
ncbi:CesT family type III secretion system chaperone [Variovorax sp. SRS16]|uniref:CesT family type III secretion system chaperone n=1 Tax=Variovorax sp. SRS16 TaxID=282217 RepID=UPI0013A56322|nr:CesT family type III secretion system chaperone [Variovorax sp. SRS16]